MKASIQVKSKNHISRKILTAFLLTLFLSCSISIAQENSNFVWSMDNLNKIGGLPVLIFGNPAVKDFSFGKAVEFDGVDDGIIVQGFPLNKEKSFTAEIIFKPYDSFPKNVEQRFLHVQSPPRNNRRFLIELRLNEKKEWYIDTHIRADSALLTCLAKNNPHPVDNWYHVVFVYNNGMARHYVNGIEEMSGKVNYIPVDSANVSLGMRMNKIWFFKGAIASVAFSKRDLKPGEFLLSSLFDSISKENTTGNLIHFDNFINDESNWIAEFEKPNSSSYKIKNGVLDISSSAGATLWYKNKLNGNVEITYDATVVDSGGVNDRVSDLNVFWMALDPANNNLFTRNGSFPSYDNLNLYYVGFGGNENSTTRFRKYFGNTKPVIKEYLDRDHLLKGNKKYSIRIICSNGITSYYMDGEKLFDYNDENPLKEGYFGIRTTRSHLQISNFKIYGLRNNSK